MSLRLNGTQPPVVSTADGLPLTFEALGIELDQNKPGNTFEDCPACEAFLKQGWEIHGFVLMDGKISSVMASPGPMPGTEAIGAFSPPPAETGVLKDAKVPQSPMLIALDPTVLGGLATYGVGGELILAGSGFCPSVQCGNLEVAVDGVSVGAVTVELDGTFRYSMMVGLPLGMHALTVHAKGGLDQAVAQLNYAVTVGDARRPEGTIPLALWPPEFLKDGTVRIRVRARAGRRYRLETSEDVERWKALPEQVPQDAEFEFIELPPAGLSGRYYGVVME